MFSKLFLGSLPDRVYNELRRKGLSRSVVRSGWQLSCSFDFSFRQYVRWLKSQPFSLLTIRMTTWTEKQETFIACSELFYFSVRFSPFRFSFHRHFPHDYIFGSTARKGIKQIDIFFFHKVFQLPWKLRRRWSLSHERSQNETKSSELR